MIRQTERTTPHRHYIASYEDAMTRKATNYSPFTEPMIFSGLGAELLGGSHYIEDTARKFDKVHYQTGMPLPNLRFHPDTLAVGENKLKPIYIKKNNFFENARKDREILKDQRNIQEEEVEDIDNESLNRLFLGGRRIKKNNKK